MRYLIKTQAESPTVCLSYHCAVSQRLNQHLTISTQGDFLAIWIYFVLHNCSLNFEIKKLHYTTDSFLCKPSILANPDYKTRKHFTDCSAYISNQDALSFFGLSSVFTLAICAHFHSVSMC